MIFWNYRCVAADKVGPLGCLVDAAVACAAFLDRTKQDVRLALKSEERVDGQVFEQRFCRRRVVYLPQLTLQFVACGAVERDMGDVFLEQRVYFGREMAVVEVLDQQVAVLLRPWGCTVRP